MSFWGAQVIVNLFGTIPGVGPELVEWIRGDYGISDATLNRFFSLHVVAVPLGLLLLVVLHIVALHNVGSNNPDGIEIKEKVNADDYAILRAVPDQLQGLVLTRCPNGIRNLIPRVRLSGPSAG